MSDVQPISGATALAERPCEEEDEFALDVRGVVAYSPVIMDCATDDNSGNTCEADASAYNSFADDPS